MSPKYHPFNFCSVLLSALLVAGVAGLAPRASLAQVTASSGIMEEIVVTSRKRAENLQDVPFSVNAQTEDMLRNRGATSLEELANNVASFTVQNLGPGQSQVAIRGVSGGQIVRDQPGVKELVGVYLDESVISLSLFTPDLDLFDLNRVEVLRGPQGTLFGSGSVGGTLRYITNKPNLSEIEVTGEASGALVDGGDFGGTVRAVLNFPIVEGKAAIRVVGYFKKFSGFIDAVQPGGGVNKDVNDGERFGGRIAIEFRPNENLTITPRVIYQEVDVNGFNRVDIFNILANPFTTTRTPVTLGKHQQFTQLQEKFTDDFLLLDATIEYDFGPVIFTSVSSYTDREILVLRDTTQLLASITAQPTIFDAPDFALIDAPLADTTDIEVFTQEVRIASSGDGRLQWLLGVFYSDIKRLYGQVLFAEGYEDFFANEIIGGPFPFRDVFPLAPVDVPFFSSIPYDFEQIAIFGEASMDVTDQLTVTAGLRWFDFTENRILNFDGILADADRIGIAADTTSDGVSPRFIIAFAATDNVQLNAQVAKGFRLGGINDPLNVPICSPEDLATFGGFETWRDETVWNYEAGAKTTILGGRGTLNVAAFFTDINNLQVTLEAGSCTSRIIFNVPKARSIGVEAELLVQPTDDFEFSMSASYTDSEFRSTVTAIDADGNPTVVAAIEKGNRLPTVPRFQFAATATFTRAVMDDMEGFLTGTFQHVGSRFTQAADADPAFGIVNIQTTPFGAPNQATFTFDAKLPSYTIGNMRIGVRNDQWEVALFINNIWNELARLAIDRERGGRARVGFLTNQPRTIGLTVRGLF